MRAVVQRVTQASVEIDGLIAGEIGPGLMVLIGIEVNDTQADADYLARKIAGLRIFDDSAGKMNRSVLDIGGSVLLVSQFTLYGDIRRGMRPSFDRAARPECASLLYNYFADQVRKLGVRVETGVFRAEMKVHLVNDGPVTLVCESVTISERSR